MDDDERRDRRRRRRRLRRRLVAADSDSRPTVVFSGIARVLRAFGTDGSVALQRAKRIVEASLRGATWTAFLVFVSLLIADGIRGGDRPQSFIFNHLWLSIAVLAISLCCLVLILIDLASYRPRLFAGCSKSVSAFFDDLARFSESLEKQIDAIASSMPTSWSEVRECEENLLAESHQFLLLDGIRFRVTLHVLSRLFVLLASLALVGYGLSGVTRGDMLEGPLADGIGLAEHTYVAVATFFTLGFGSIHPAHDAVGYAYLTLILAVFVAVVYFVLTEIVASQSDFRTNIRCAAETFVVQNSAL
jgi:hypothetical protein